MSFHRTSSSSSSSPSTMLNSKRQFATTILLLSTLFIGAMAHPRLDSLWATQNDDDELLASANGEQLFHELKKYHQKQHNYLAKWPGLRDLVLTIDYDDDTTTTMENNEFLERLQQLGAPAGELFDDVREYNDNSFVSSSMKGSKSPSNQITIKEHNTKKNVQFRKQYMSPCHFKICNMGRKRNSRLLAKN